MGSIPAPAIVWKGLTDGGSIAMTQRLCKLCDAPLPQVAHMKRLYCNQTCKDRASSKKWSAASRAKIRVEQAKLMKGAGRKIFMPSKIDVGNYAIDAMIRSCI